MIFSGSNLLPHRSVGDNLRFAHGPAAAHRDLRSPRTGIAPLLDRRPNQLSAAESQSVAIASLCPAAPRLLFLDDPLFRGST